MKQQLRIRLIHDEHDESFLVPGDQTLIGRADSLLVKLTSCPTLSREHLEVRIHDSKIWIKDRGSSNGSYLDGVRLPVKKWVHYTGQDLVLGDLDSGTEVWIEAIEVAEPETQPNLTGARIQSQQIVELAERLEMVKHEIAAKEQEKIAIEERQAAMLRRVEELIFREVELFKNIDLLKAQSEEFMVECETIEQMLKDWEAQKTKAEIELSRHEASLQGIQDFNREEEDRLQAKKADLAAQLESLESERKGAVERHALELDRLAAEKKLRNTQFENEIEELKSKKLLLERQLEGLESEIRFSEERIPKLKQEWDTLNQTLSANRQELSELREQIPKRKSELQELESKSIQLREEVESARGEAIRILEAARAEAKKIDEESLATVANRESQCDLELQIKRADGDREVRKKVEAMKKELEVKRAAFEQEKLEARARLDADLLKMRQALEDEIQIEKEKFRRDEDAFEKARTEELRRQREKGLEDLRATLAAETLRSREAITEQRVLFSKRVAASTLTALEGQGHSVPGALLSSLEATLLSSVEEYSKGEGFQIETFEVSKKKFMRKATFASFAAVAGILGLIFGPEVFQKKIEVLKRENAAANASFIRELREQRERMLALHLESRKDFQDTYVDNLLYNPGYLAMKQDEAIQKEWTSALSRFFFEQLLLDDQKVVNYLPIETSLIRGLAETNKVLNSANFEVNLSKMRALEVSRMPDLWIAAGGKENWVKLRKFEADFYRARVTTLGEPASSIDARNPAGARN